MAVGQVKALGKLGRYREAAAILDTLEVLPSEGATDVHALFVRTHIHLGLEKMEQEDFAGAISHLEKSRKYPENLGTGRPYVPDQRCQQYLIALCHLQTGNSRAAEALFEAVADETRSHWKAEGPYAYFGALALLRKGSKGEASELLRRAPRPDERLLAAVERFRR